MTLVLMQFGDGSHKEISVDAQDPEEACKEARDWVNDNAWFEVYDDDGGEQLAEVSIRDLRRI